jgi:WD40 repeat protein
MCAAWNHDGSRIVTAGCDQTAKIWDTKSGADLLTLMGHTDRIDCVSWSSDGWRIVTGSEDKTAKIWDARAFQAKAQPNANGDGPGTGR